MKGSKARESSILIFVCGSDGGSQYSVKKGGGGGLHFKLQGRRRKE